MRIFPLGESALTIEFGDRISAELNDRAIAFSRYFERTPFPGLIETVPAYSSVTLFYNAATVRRSFFDYSSAYAAVESVVRKAIEGAAWGGRDALRVVEIPILVSEKDSPDLAAISDRAEMRPDDVIDIFLSRAYRVYMIGFLPGFPYMGEVDERIAAPRLATPRARVPAGSIGIAGKQAGIYPLDSPGGWNLIGRTDRAMFNPAADPTCLLAPGDEVKFVRK